MLIFPDVPIHSSSFPSLIVWFIVPLLFNRLEKEFSYFDEQKLSGIICETSWFFPLETVLLGVKDVKFEADFLFLLLRLLLLDE